MIATLSGIVSEKIGASIVLDVNGVGYELSVANQDFSNAVLGQPAKFYVYEHIREQSYDLYAFLETNTKRLFELLLSVNGVGPKMALSVLDLGSISEVIQAIAQGDVKFIQSASGVGKRIAERVVVDLKDKVGVDGKEADLSFLSSSSPGDEAVEALEALGFSRDDAARALSGIDSKLTIEERVRQALKHK